MKILIRNQKEKEWHLVESAAYTKEKDLHHLLTESPGLISISEIRPGAGPLVLAVPELTLPVGYIDLLAFNANGDIAVVECKLAANPEVKRKVIGQVLEYAANLWGMSYEDLDNAIRVRMGDNLAELVKNAVGSPDWDEENFRMNVAATLASGNFMLIIVVDEISSELSRIVSFINVSGRPSFAFAALEMRRFKSGGTEMLVPRMFGPVGPPPLPPLARHWDETSFFNELGRQHGEQAVGVARRILEWASGKTQLIWGKGKQSGSFVPVIDHNGVKHQLFAVYTYGVVEIYFQWYREKDPFKPADKRLELLNRLNQIDGVDLSPESIDRRPSIKLSVLSRDAAIQHFLATFDWMLDEITRY